MKVFKIILVSCSIRMLVGCALGPKVLDCPPDTTIYNETSRVVERFNDGLLGKELYLPKSSCRGVAEGVRPLVENGPYKVWYDKEKTKLKKVGQYKNDKLDGPFSEFYEDGKLKAEGFFHEDIKTGLWREYYNSGSRQSEGTFVNGLKDGMSSKWYANGNREEESVYLNDILTSSHQRWYANGQPKDKGTYDNGKESGEWNSWFDNGAVKFSGNFINGKEDGEVKSWYANGQIESSGQYKLGISVNKYERWHKNGKKAIEEEYNDNGIKTSVQKWDENGISLYELKAPAINRIYNFAVWCMQGSHSSLTTLQRSIVWKNSGYESGHIFLDSFGGYITGDYGSHYSVAPLNPDDDCSIEYVDPKGLLKAVARKRGLARDAYGSSEGYQAIRGETAIKLIGFSEKYHSIKFELLYFKPDR